MKETLIIVNSADGKHLSSDGSSFDVEFDVMIKTGGDPHLKVLSSTIWYTFPNIKTGVNDTLIVKHGAALANTVTLTIPQGLYGIQELNDAIQHEIESTGLAAASNLGSKTAIAVGGNFATGQASVTITIQPAPSSQHIEIDWVNSTISPLLGFTTNTSLNASSGVLTQTTFSDNIANLAPVSSLQIRCSAARGSVVSGKTGSDVIASVQIDASVGHQIMYAPSVTPRIAAPAFTDGIQRMRMRLTDQDGNDINTQGEYWSATLLLEW